MKTKIAAFLAFALLFSHVAFAKSVQCDKLMRGLEGFGTAPVEYLNQYQIAADEQGPVATAASTIVLGTFMTGKRFINGAYDVITFPLNWPKEYRLLFPDASPTAWDSHKTLQNNNMQTPVSK